MRQYGPEDIAGAIENAAAARAFGAGYVANILRQQRSPRRPQPPLRLRDPLLIELTTDPISPLEYDAFILESGKERDDSSEASARNLSVSATIELLADLELESRQGRAMERRFKCSRPQAQPSIDAFHFHRHKSRVQANNRILRLLDLSFLRQGANLVPIPTLRFPTGVTYDTQRVYRLPDFTKAQLIRPGVAYCIAPINSTL